jgi:DNA-binding XRE family transcriptional regulator
MLLDIISHPVCKSVASQQFASYSDTQTMAHHRDKPDLGKFLGQQIAAHRTALNLTQNQLAERLGVEPETVSRFERGSSLPSLKRLLTRHDNA